MPKWRRPPEDLVDRFLSLVPDDPGVDVRRMFGCPCFFCGGNMFAGVHQENLFVGWETTTAPRCWRCRAPGISSPCRPAHARVRLRTSGHAHRPPALENWLARSLAYVRTLPPKQGKRRGPQ